MRIVAATAPADHAATDCPAHRLTPAQRAQLARDALAQRPISHLAEEHDVSRKFVYQQLQHAQDAIDQAFTPKPQPDEPVLFQLPVTKAWLRQFVLALVFSCHSPLRGVCEVLTDLFDYHLSLGTAHNIVQQAVATARQVNAAENLSRVRIGLHDEIFQGQAPVLVGVDADSTYCYLLSLEEHRDGDTWGVRLLEAADRGLDPDATVADFAKGQRSGQEQAWPGVPCRGDVFHALDAVGTLVRAVESRAYGALETVEGLRQQQQHRRRQARPKDQSVAQKLRHARAEAARAVTLADDLALLAQWLQHDLLSVAGPDHASRAVLWDFVVAELAQREEQYPHRIGPVRRLLQNQKAELLAFVATLDQDLAALAADWQVPTATVRAVLHCQQLDERQPRRWRQTAALQAQLGGRYHGVSVAVAELARRVVRASSLVENLNSRLRSYFFLRRQLGADYLELLRFCRNHRRFPRSEHAERVGKSPAELLSGTQHVHWLELLGYERFSRN